MKHKFSKKKATILVISVLFIISALATAWYFLFYNTTEVNLRIIRASDTSAAEEAYQSQNNVVVISSKVECEQYFEKMTLFDEPPFINIHSNELSPNAIGLYNDDFFENNYLVAVLLIEGSGSISHKVKRITESGDIIIKKIYPKGGIMTDDMATWHFLIELDNDFKPESFNLVLQDKKPRS